MGALINCKPVQSNSITVTSGQAVGGSASVTLDIEPINDSYVVAAENFSYNHASINNNKITASNVTKADTGTAYTAGNKVRFTIDLDDSFTPTQSETLTVDLAGEATLKDAKKYRVTGRVKYSLNQASPTPTPSAFDKEGQAGETVVLSQFVVTMNSGYYLPSTSTTDVTWTFISNANPTVTYQDNYEFVVIPVAYSGQYITSFILAVYYTFPQDSYVTATIPHDTINVETNSALIPTQASLITGYNINTDGILPSGESRDIKIHGSTGAAYAFTVTNDAGHTYNPSTDTFTSASTSITGTISGNANEHTIVIPSVSSNDSYDFSIAGTGSTNTTEGGNGNNNPFTFTLNQYIDTTLTINATTSNGWTITNNDNNITGNNSYVLGNSQYIALDTLDIDVTHSSALYLRRQPDYDLDLSNTNPSSNGGYSWFFQNFKASGNGTTKISITTDTEGWLLDAAGTADLTSVLSLDNFINTPSVANNTTFSATEDTALSINLSTAVTDNSESGLTYSIVADNSSSNGTLGSVNSSTGVLTYTPALNNTTTITFTFKVNDGYQDSNTATATVTVAAVADAPTNITMSSQSINENNSINDVVGAFSSVDPDGSGSYTYTLVSGTGDTDNSSFNISGSNLRASAVFDYETKNSYSIRVRSTDADGSGNFEKQFTIAINDVTETVNSYQVSRRTAMNGFAGFGYIHPTQICDSGSLATTCMDFSTLGTKYVRVVSSCGGTSEVAQIVGSSTSPVNRYVVGDTYYDSFSDANTQSNGTTC